MVSGLWHSLPAAVHGGDGRPTPSIIHCLRSILDACGTLSQPDAPKQGDKLAQTFAEACAVGMQDNWSQVRYAASVANRSLLQALSLEDRDQFYPRLLPRMCLNR